MNKKINKKNSKQFCWGVILSNLFLMVRSMEVIIPVFCCCFSENTMSIICLREVMFTGLSVHECFWHKQHWTNKRQLRDPIIHIIKCDVLILHQQSYSWKFRALPLQWRPSNKDPRLGDEAELGWCRRHWSAHDLCSLWKRSCGLCAPAA